MCGIAGMVAIHGASVEPERLATMLRVMAHRGPDGHGIYTGREAGLAHARLSIIDTSPFRLPPWSRR